MSLPQKRRDASYAALFEINYLNADNFEIKELNATNIDTNQPTLTRLPSPPALESESIH